MKIVDDNPNLLVMKESAIKGQLIGIVLVIVGAGVMALGFLGKVHNSVVVDGFGAIFVIAGFLVFFLTKSDTVTADKTSRQLTVNFKSMKNKQGQSQSVSFDDISSVQLFQEMQQFNNMGNMGGGSGLNLNMGGMGVGNSRTSIIMSLAVQLKSGTAITIAKEQRQGGINLGISSNSLTSKGQKLASVLGVPFQESGAMTAGQMISSVKDAVVGEAGAFSQVNPGSDSQPTQVSSSQPPVNTPAQETPLPKAPEPQAPNLAPNPTQVIQPTNVGEQPPNQNAQ